MRRVAALGEGQGVTVHVGGLHLARHRCVFGRGGRVVAGGGVVVRVAWVVELGRVVDGGDTDVDGGGGGATLAVRDRDGERIRTVEVLGGGVGPGAVRVDHHGAVLRIGALGESQCVAIGIRRGHGARHRGVLGRGEAVVAGAWVEVAGAAAVHEGRGDVAVVEHGGGLDAPVEPIVGRGAVKRLRRHDFHDAIDAQAFAHGRTIATGQAGRGRVFLVAAFDAGDRLVQAGCALRRRLRCLARRRAFLAEGQGAHGGAGCFAVGDLNRGARTAEHPVTRHEGVADPQGFGRLLAFAHDLQGALDAQNDTGGGEGRRLSHGDLSKCNSVQSIASLAALRPPWVVAMRERMQPLLGFLGT